VRIRVDRTGSGSCLLAAFAISSVEYSGSAAKELITKMNIGEIVCEKRSDWNWIRIAFNGGLYNVYRLVTWEGWKGSAKSLLSENS
jgi:hypothetical protein